MLSIFAQRKKPAPTPYEQEQAALIAQIRETRKLLDTAYAHFDMTSDSDMIDYHIHQINSLSARYRYLLRKIRQESMRCPTELLTTSIERVYEKLG